MGQETPPAPWAAVSGAGETALLDALERAAEAGVQEETPAGAVRIVHALARTAPCEGLLARCRRAWSRRP
jgi:hypothetical protein